MPYSNNWFYMLLSKAPDKFSFDGRAAFPVKSSKRLKKYKEAENSEF